MHTLSFFYLSYYLGLVLVSDDHVILKSMLTSSYGTRIATDLFFVFCTTCLSAYRLQLKVFFSFHVHTKHKTGQILMNRTKATGGCLEFCVALAYLNYCIIVWGSTYKTNL